MSIALLVPDVPSAEELLPYLKRIDASHWYTNFGPLVQEFETQMAAHLSQGPVTPQHAVTVCNATLGLEVALLALKLSPGSRILMPALTFVATATAAIRAGFVPVFCDVDPGNWLLTPQIALAANVHTHFDAVMPVATYGCPCDTQAWDEFSSQTNIPVVIDAAGAFGNQTCGVRVIVVFSLHATKAFATAEGGLVISADAAYADRVRHLANFGIDSYEINDGTEGISGLVSSAGTNAKLSEYHAALGLAAMARLKSSFEHRISLHARYLHALRALSPGVALQARADAGIYSILPILLPPGNKAADAFRYLRERDIETRRWYCPPLTDHPAFKSLPVLEPLDVTGALSERLLALPFHLFLGENDIQRVSTMVGEFLHIFAANAIQ